jgi:hypothetical protein
MNDVLDKALESFLKNNKIKKLPDQENEKTLSFVPNSDYYLHALDPEIWTLYYKKNGDPYDRK